MIIPTGVQMTSEENTTYANAYSDIGTYVGQYTLQAIMGDVDIDATWDEYVAAIEAMNIATCIQQQQSALVAITQHKRQAVLSHDEVRQHPLLIGITSTLLERR